MWLHTMYIMYWVQDYDSVLFTATFSLGNMLGSAFYPDIEITYMTSILYQARRLKPIRLVYFRQFFLLKCTDQALKVSTDGYWFSLCFYDSPFGTVLMVLYFFSVFDRSVHIHVLNFLYHMTAALWFLLVTYTTLTINDSNYNGQPNWSSCDYV